ncbi:MAG: SBBP repeat-containing protein [Bacteroidetes bacterium]|nr:SBBP repeat-containing protein [Bacteroidota bacterium]
MCLVRFSFGQTLPIPAWMQNIGSDGGLDEGYGIATDAAGNIYIVGEFKGRVDFDPSSTSTYTLLANGSTDGFVAKYTSNGNFLWAFNIGGSDIASIKSIKLDGAGNIYICGLFSGNNIEFDPSVNTFSLNALGTGLATDAFIAKYDGNQTPNSTSFFQWAFPIGNVWTDQANALTVDGLGNIYVTGHFNISSDFDPSVNSYTVGANADVFVAKYDANLTPSSTSFFKWAFAIGGITAGDSGYGIETDASGNVYLTGEFASTADFNPSSGTANFNGGNGNAFVAKYDGNLLPSSTSFYKWAFHFGGPIQDVAYSLDIDSLGYLYVTGNFSGSNIDMNPSSVTSTISSLGGSTNCYLAKYDGNLTPTSTSFYQWAFAIGDSTSSMGKSVTIKNNNIYLTGYFGKKADFDPSINTYSLSAIANDVFVASYDNNLNPTATGFLKWSFNIGGIYGDVGNAIHFNPVTSNIVVTGAFSGQNVDFDPSSASNTLSSTWPISGDAFCGIYSNNGNYINAFPLGNSYAGNYVNTVATDVNGNVFAAGNFTGIIDFDLGPGIWELNSINGRGFVAKYNSSGNLLWAFNIYSECKELDVDPYGNVYLASQGTLNNNDYDPSPNTFTLNPPGALDILITKYDGNLSPGSTSFFKWAFPIGGATGADMVFGLDVDSLQQVYVTGYVSDTVDFDPSINTNIAISNPGNQDVFLAKYDGSLTPASSSFHKWGFLIGGNGNYDLGFDITSDKAGNVFVCGRFSGNNIDFDPSTSSSYTLTANANLDIFVAKYNGNLTPSSASFTQWAFNAGGIGDDEATAICVDSIGGVYITGTFHGTGIDFNPSSSMNGTSSLGFSDAFVAKYDGTQLPSSSSFFKWVFNLGGNNYDVGADLALYKENLYVSGFFYNTVDFNPPTYQTYTISSPGYYSQYIACYNTNFTPSSNSFFKGAFSIVGANSGSKHELYTDDNGSLYATGGYKGNLIEFDPTSTTLLSSSEGKGTLFSGFLVKYGSFCSFPSVPIVTTNTVTCIGVTNTVSLSGANLNNASNWTWYIGGCGGTPVGTGTAIVMTHTAPANVTYYVRGEGGCVGSLASCGSVFVFVNALPSIGIVGNDTLCFGKNMTLIGTGANTYTWNSSIVSNTLNVSPTVTTTYSLSGTDLNGCINSTTLGMTVIPSPTISIIGVDSICYATTTTLTATGGTSYIWSTGPLTNTIVVTPFTTTTYSVIGISGVCNSTASHTITIKPSPIITFTCSAPGWIWGPSCQQTATITANGASTYSWNTGSNLQTIVVSPSVTTNYMVYGTFVNGCASSGVYPLTVYPCTDVNEINLKNNISIYPNPTSNLIFISTTSQEEFVEIYNSEGKEILKRNIFQGTTEFNLDKLSAGLYLIKINSKTYRIVLN